MRFSGFFLYFYGIFSLISLLIYLSINQYSFAIWQTFSCFAFINKQAVSILQINLENFTQLLITKVVNILCYWQDCVNLQSVKYLNSQNKK